MEIKKNFVRQNCINNVQFSSIGLGSIQNLQAVL